MGKSVSTTNTWAQEWNLANLTNPIVGNTGAVSINYLDAGAILAGTNVANNAIAGMNDAVTSVLMGMTANSLGTIEALERIVNGTNQATQAITLGALESSSDVARNSAGLLGQSTQAAISLADRATERATDLTIGVLARDQARSEAAINAVNGAQAAAYEFAYQAGRPEAATMQSAGKVLMVVGGILAAAIMFRGKFA